MSFAHYFSPFNDNVSVVVNENCLCTVELSVLTATGYYNYETVLHRGSILKGYGGDPYCFTIKPSDKVRKATLADFEAFRVHASSFHE